MGKMKRLISRIIVAAVTASLLLPGAMPVYAADAADVIFVGEGETEEEIIPEEERSEDESDEIKSEEAPDESDEIESEEVSEESDSEDASEKTSAKENPEETGEEDSGEADSVENPGDTENDKEEDLLEEGDIVVNEENFPDEFFRTYVLNEFCVDNILSEEARNAVTEIDVHEAGIESLQGIGFFPNLQSLICNGNHLKMLDLSGNTELQTLIADENDLETIDLSSNTKLTRLSVGRNPLSGVDVSALTELLVFACVGAGLTELNLSSNTKLEILLCDGNNFETLDLSRNEKLLESLKKSVKYTDYDSHDFTGEVVGKCTAYLYNAAGYMAMTIDEGVAFSPSYEELMQSVEEYHISFIQESTVSWRTVKKGQKTSRLKPNPVKEGHIFDGWYTTPDCETPFDFDAPVTCNYDLYPAFVEGEVKIHNVYYIDGATTYRMVRVARGDLIENYILSKSGVTFVGWFKDVDFTQPYDFSAPVTSSFKLYAKWSNDKTKWTVKFMDGSEALKTEKVEEGSKVKKFEATKEGYKLLGWYKDAALKTAYDFNSPVTSNLTLYAKWEKLIPTFSVTDFGAVPNDNKDDFAAFQRAFAKASDYDEPIIIQIPEGTFLVSGGLGIQSDTHVIADQNAVIKFSSSASGSVLYGDPKEDAAKGGYEQLYNIEIEGGTWDRNSSSGTLSSAFTLRHGKNIKIHDLTIKGCTDHMINISADQNVEIKNVTFRDHIAYTGTDPNFWGGHAVGDKTRYGFVEVIHTDFAGSGEPGISPADGTSCKNIVIDRCRFMSTQAGIGTHHSTTSSKGDGLTVTNCTFSTVQYGAVLNAWSVLNVNFTGNTVNYANADREAAIIITDGASGKAEGNTITAPGVMGFKIRNSTFSPIRNNISGATNYGIFAEGGTVSVTGNIVSDSAYDGIRIAGGSSHRIDGNTVSGSPKYGIYVYQCSTGVTVINNKVSGTSTTASGIYLEDDNGKTDLSEGYYVRNGNSYDGYNYIAANTVTTGLWGGIYVNRCCAVIIGNNVTSGPHYAIATEGNAVTFEMKYNYLQGDWADILLGKTSVNCRLIENTYTGAGVVCLEGSSYNEMLDFTSNSISVSPITQYMTYTGKAVKQNLTVTRGGERLTENVDYTVSYSDNVKVGKATVMLSGKGKYSGTRVYTFWILKADSVVFKYSDIKPDAWYVDAVQYVSDKGIMTGADGKFSPNNKVTRNMVTQMLYAKEGKPKVTTANPFSDVVKGQWYYDSVIWAYEKKITSGKPDGTFGVGKPVTRLDFAIMLYTYAQYKHFNLNKRDTAINSFSDASKVKYGRDAMNWAVTQGIISGKGGNRLDPGGNATRAECATMIMQLLKKNGQ